jgi:thiamine-phosphate pyrophosphorylase
VAGRCQPLLIGPPSCDPEAFALQLDSALAIGGVAGFLLRLAAPEPAAVEGAALHLRPVCAAREVAFLLQDDVALARRIGADGVQLTGARGVAAARSALGAERIVGAACGVSRDAAMVAGDAGADYIAFGDPDGPLTEALGELIAWWSDLCVLPCLAEGALQLADCAALAQGGADLIGVSALVWQHPDGPAAGMKALGAALARG